MASNNSKELRMVIVDSDAATRGRVKQWVASRGVRVVAEAEDTRTGYRMTRGLQPDLILLELPENDGSAMEFVKEIRMDSPGTSIILSASKASPELILSSMRAGANEFVARPIDEAELEKAIDHLRRVNGGAPSGRKRGRVIAVATPKGGTGATSVTANLGLALQERTDSKVVLVDMSFQFGDLGVMFDALPRYSLTDALADGSVEESRLRTVILAHDTGVHLLNVSASPEVAEEIHRQHVVDLLGMLTNMFDYVLVDIGRQLDDRTVEVLELCDSVLLVTALDVPTIRNTVFFTGLMEKLKIDRQKVSIVVNRFVKKGGLSVEDVEALVSAKVFWSIPNDYVPVSSGIERGMPAVRHAPRSRVAKNFLDLADRIQQMRGAPEESVEVAG